jgi:cyanophycinase
MTAVAHYPQLLGLGIDFNTAAIFTDGKFKVAGEGVVTVIDASEMRHSDLPYRSNEETIGMFGVVTHVLPAGYSFEIETRTPLAPRFSKLAGAKAD